MIQTKTKKTNAAAKATRKKAEVSPDAETLARQEIKRSRKNDWTRRHIAEIAIPLFENQGFAATTIDEIASAADYSTSTFFRLFADKEEVVFYGFADLLENLKASFAMPNHGTAWTTIRETFISIAHGWDVDEGELGIRRLRLIYKEPFLYSRFLSKASDWEVEMAKLISSEYRNKDEPNQNIICELSARAAAAAFLAGWRIKFNDDHPTLEDCVRNAFDQMAEVGRLFQAPTTTQKLRSPDVEI